MDTTAAQPGRAFARTFSATLLRMAVRASPLLAAAFARPPSLARSAAGATPRASLDGVRRHRPVPGAGRRRPSAVRRRAAERAPRQQAAVAYPGDGGALATGPASHGHAHRPGADASRRCGRPRVRNVALFGGEIRSRSSRSKRRARQRPRRRRRTAFGVPARGPRRSRRAGRRRTRTRASRSGTGATPCSSSRPWCSDDGEGARLSAAS